jgi:hypothetical protein
METSTRTFMTSTRLAPGDAKIKSWHDDRGMTVRGITIRADGTGTWRKLTFPGQRNEADLGA